MTYFDPEEVGARRWLERLLSAQVRDVDDALRERDDDAPAVGSVVVLHHGAVRHVLSKVQGARHDDRLVDDLEEARGLALGAHDLVEEIVRELDGLVRRRCDVLLHVRHDARVLLGRLEEARDRVEDTCNVLDRLHHWRRDSRCFCC